MKNSSWSNYKVDDYIIMAEDLEADNCRETSKISLKSVSNYSPYRNPISLNLPKLSLKSEKKHHKDSVYNDN
jgi:hypothetical protein